MRHNSRDPSKSTGSDGTSRVPSSRGSSAQLRQPKFGMQWTSASHNIILYLHAKFQLQLLYFRTPETSSDEKSVTYNHPPSPPSIYPTKLAQFDITQPHLRGGMNYLRYIYFALVLVQYQLFTQLQCIDICNCSNISNGANQHLLDGRLLYSGFDNTITRFCSEITESTHSTSRLGLTHWLVFAVLLK